MRLLESVDYQQDIKKIASQELPWDKLNHSTICITGATGMIGSFLVDVLMHRNLQHNADISIVSVGRSLHKAQQRFTEYWNHPGFIFWQADIMNPLDEPPRKIDYLLHLASNTHPIAYATDPIGTITANSLGTYHLLQVAAAQQTRRFLFASSVEIYGASRGETDIFSEDYCGYIDCNTLRAGYPESKRMGEALCQAFIAQKGMDVVIPRFARCFGPTMLMDDSKAISQFIRNAIKGENIVLKSAGTQVYSYSYVADAVSGLLFALLLGDNGGAYNIAAADYAVSLKDIATRIAESVNAKVIVQEPEKIESIGFSKAARAILDGTKIKRLGWKPLYGFNESVARTVSILAGDNA